MHEPADRIDPDDAEEPEHQEYCRDSDKHMPIPKRTHNECLVKLGA